MAIALLIAPLAAVGPLHAAPLQGSAAQPEACELLAGEEIRTVQNATVKERKRSDHRDESLHFAQCFYVTTDFARSVSLTVIRGDAESAGATAVRRYWDNTFGPRRPEVSKAASLPETNTGEKSSPRRVAGPGEEAFWTGDARAGTLYVLGGGVVLRISVGGVTEEEERIRRSKALAEAALRRVRAHH